MPLWLLVQPVLLSDMLWHHPDHWDPPNRGSWPYNVSPLMGHVVAPKGHVGHIEQCAHALRHASRHVGCQSDDAQTTGMQPSCSSRLYIMSPAAWQQAQWLSRLPDLSLGHNNEVQPHGVLPQPPCVLNTHIDVPTFLGMSPRLRRAGWEATKAT